MSFYRNPPNIELKKIYFQIEISSSVRQRCRVRFSQGTQLFSTIFDVQNTLQNLKDED